MNHLQAPQSNLETVKRLYKLFNQRKWSEIAGLHTEKTGFLNNRSNFFVVREKDALPALYAALGRRYPGLKEKILYIEESGSRVYVQFQTSGQDRNGDHWQEIVWAIFTVEEGKIAKIASFFNDPGRLSARAAG